MTYETALQKIHSLLTFGSRPGLDRMRTLLAEMGNPQDNLKYIHIAGTNGKGSVCAMLSSALIAAGYKTGLFISPYITDFRERIQINNTPVAQAVLVSAVEKTFPIVERLQSRGVVITEFEYVNALQFYIHSVEKCDIVVLETGMGGLLDCTNVIKPPLCSVITTIGLDHTALLGDTVEKIAEQKCGIIKENSIAVTSAQSEGAMGVIESTVKRLRVPLARSRDINIDIKEEKIEGSVFEYEKTPVKLNLAGEHQLENAKTALAALEVLRLNGLIHISNSQISSGFEKAKNPARLELLSKEPVVLLDGAHNPNGIEALKKFINRFLGEKKVIGIMGMLADKDIESSIKMLENVFDRVLAVPVDNPRALPAHELAKKFKEAQAFESAEDAFNSAFEQAKRENSAVVVFGSLYLAGELRPHILEKIKF